MAGKFEIKKSNNGQFYFNLKAGNGEVILTGETYVAKESAQQGIASVKANSPHDGQYERKTAANNQPYFILKATNGQTIGKSEMYSSATAMENGIASVKANAPTATIVDLTGS
jgi:uncharacterized protein YegP (UPF0339 family)